MYTRSYNVPVLTKADVERIVTENPALKVLVKIPATDTPEAAVAFASQKVREQINSAPYEFIAEVLSTQLDSEGKNWKVEFKILGD